jgi:hypothetical protein
MLLPGGHQRINALAYVASTLVVKRCSSARERLSALRISPEVYAPVEFLAAKLQTVG